MSMMGKMPKLGERGIIHFIVLLILLAGLVAGLYLVQHTQIFEPKAGGNITRVEIVDNDGNPIATTDTTKVKLKVTWVNLPEASESGNVNGVSSNKLLAQAPTEKLIRGPLTFISASPNPCPLGNVGSASEKHCKTAISWGTLSETDPIQVYVSRPGPGIPIPKQLFAANRSGTQDANWIPEEGAIFELYSGAKCTESNIEGTSGCFYDADTGTLLKSVQVTTYSTQTFPQSFRAANSYEELSQAQERLFYGNPTTIDWELNPGAGSKVVYAQFNLGGIWGGMVKSSIELTGTQPPFNVTLSADPTTVTSGQQTTLSWTIMGAVTSCDLSLGVSEDVSAQGGQASPIVTSGSKTITLTNSTSKSLTQTFTLGCSDGNGNAVQSSADVKVLPVLTECTVPQFVRSFNSYFGDSRYISICDFNKDEVINIFDIYYLLNQQPHI